ncbi:hypothetical protein [Halobacterium salinarum]|uniref:Uncharacterized protein n=3 Tax=Halobacterium salinarum TaxID=2242 RepID=A0A510N9C9_HALSA|nr:hypothetical protein [Halobacterium salinarum]MBB6089097.1 hypothetical protein [Halobacterium salinarum]MDL0119527.1 hypothetical protein [Halobacterium salinarum]MDL0132182.1 hypothetical protein [Halobacterium salinarum]MDL0137362.1 hypothetical protein [Halobacterium salinarum]MDL0140569.1 hypothetical protein [Halobacterium salinarum]
MKETIEKGDNDRQNAKIYSNGSIKAPQGRNRIQVIIGSSLIAKKEFRLQSSGLPDHLGFLMDYNKEREKCRNNGTRIVISN